MSFESWQYHPQLPDAIDLARSFPDTTIILKSRGRHSWVGPYAAIGGDFLHLAHAHRRAGEMSERQYELAAGHGLGRFDFHERDVPPPSEDLAAAWRPYIETCIEAFGVNRCMFESNFPRTSKSCGYTELWNAFKRITSNASAAEKTALYSGTRGARVSDDRA